jgi:hypothetical protein
LNAYQTGYGIAPVASLCYYKFGGKREGLVIKHHTLLLP